MITNEKIEAIKLSIETLKHALNVMRKSGSKAQQLMVFSELTKHYAMLNEEIAKEQQLRSNVIAFTLA